MDWSAEREAWVCSIRAEMDGATDELSVWKHRDSELLLSTELVGEVVSFLEAL